MGMYTELVLKCDLNYNLTEEQTLILNWLLKEGDKPVQLPDHPFFHTPCGDMIGKSCSFYHHPESIVSWTDDYLFIRIDIKNYDGEITKFVDWLKPILNHVEGDCIGWSWCEEESTPTLLMY